MQSDLMEKIVSLCKRRGFIFQSSEIYGGLANSWDYGPLGAELKRNLKDAWWKAVVHDREDMVGLDSGIVMHPEIWRASGQPRISSMSSSIAGNARTGSARTISSTINARTAVPRILPKAARST